MIVIKGYVEQQILLDKFVVENMYIVCKIVWYMFGCVGCIVEIDDLLQVGYMGLIDVSWWY